MDWSTTLDHPCAGIASALKSIKKATLSATPLWVICGRHTQFGIEVVELLPEFLQTSEGGLWLCHRLRILTVP